MNKLFELSSITKVYSQGSEKVFALNNVSFYVEEEEYLSIVGPSGSGKTTLLNIIGGLDYPSGGKVSYKGRDLGKMSDYERTRWRRKNIGFIFQFYHLIEELNVFENILIATREKRKTSLKKIKELLKYLEIEERIDFFPSQLSGGEKQKVAIARALINDPEVLLCDEPTGNLDVDSQEKVMSLLRKVNKEMGKTIILVTHNTELINESRRRIFIKGGKIVDICSM